MEQRIAHHAVVNPIQPRPDAVTVILQDHAAQKQSVDRPASPTGKESKKKPKETKNPLFGGGGELKTVDAAYGEGLAGLEKEKERMEKERMEKEANKKPQKAKKTSFEGARPAAMPMAPLGEREPNALHVAWTRAVLTWLERSMCVPDSIV